jgi:twitching motility protein PilT
MDESIWGKLRDGYVSPMEAYMKAIDKSRFKGFLPPEDQAVANAGGGEAKK